MFVCFLYHFRRFRKWNAPFSYLSGKTERKLKLKHKMSTAANSHWAAKRNQKSRNATHTLRSLGLFMCRNRDCTKPTEYWIRLQYYFRSCLDSDHRVLFTSVIRSEKLLKTVCLWIYDELGKTRTNEDDAKCAGLKIRMAFSLAISLSPSVTPICNHRHADVWVSRSLGYFSLTQKCEVGTAVRQRQQNADISVRLLSNAEAKLWS